MSLDRLFIKPGEPPIEIRNGVVYGDFGTLFSIYTRHTEKELYRLNCAGQMTTIEPITGSGMTKEGIFRIFRPRVIPAITGV